jgi:hypothetical protein
MVGSPPGDALRQLTAQAAGNPLYLRELVDALVRERALQISPAAVEVSVFHERLPASLAAVLSDRLSSVSAETAQMLRTATLLRGKFTVTDLAVLPRRPASQLAAGLQEAVAAGILVRPAAPAGPGSAHPECFRPGEPGLPGRRVRARAGAERRNPPGHAGAGRDVAAARR